MSGPLTIHFIRHGEVHNPESILYGRMPGYFLSDNGREQAKAAAQAIRDRHISKIFASPMERAQQTAHIIANGNGRTPDIVTDERLNEVHSPFDGTPHEELEKTWFDLYTGTEPPYEQPQDIRQRVLDFLRDVRAQHAGEEVAAVSHGDIVVAMFLYAHEKPAHDIARGKLLDYGLPEPYPVTASISTLEFKTDDVDEVPSYRYLRPY